MVSAYPEDIYSVYVDDVMMQIWYPAAGKRISLTATTSILIREFVAFLRPHCTMKIDLTEKYFDILIIKSATL
jgi:hypothetical protein